MRTPLLAVGFGTGFLIAIAAGCNQQKQTSEENLPEASGGVGVSSSSAPTSGGSTGTGSSTASSKGGGGAGSSTGTVTNVGGQSRGGTTSGASVGGGSVSLVTQGGGTSNTSAGGASATVTNRGGSSATSNGGASLGGATQTSGSTVPRGGSTSGTSASVGGASTTSTVGTGGLSRGPTPASATAKFPFPQNRQSANCIYPKEYKNEDVKSVYEKWKADLVTSDGAGGFRRVKRPDEPGLEKNSTVSEGIAYGMMIAVYMNDQPLFDDLWKYELLHTWSSTPWGGGNPTPTLLMNWYISSSGAQGKDPDGGGAATDADEDMAWALVMADKQWGGQGTLSKSYLDYAKQMIGDIWKYEILDSKLPKNGSGWGDWNNLNISYFAPAYYRVFAKVSGNAAWNDGVVKCVYDTIESNLTAANGNQTNGLVPAFSTSTGGNAQSDPPQNLRHDYQYDSCRTPFRIGVDACLFNDTRAKTYLAKTSQFFAGIGAADIKDGYSLSGSPTPEWGSRGFQGRSAAFIGPAGVGAMHNGTYQSFVDNVWDLVRQNNMWCGGQYYDESWTMLTMLMMSGNFLDYTVETPK